jgi:hypothetical protein
MYIASAIIEFFDGVADAAAQLWARIVGWARDSAYPWLQDHLPSLAEDFMQCMDFLDGLVVKSIRVVRAAWTNVKQYLLSMAVEIKQNTDTEWVRRASGYWIDALNQNKVMKTTETQILNWDELPPDIREQFLRRGKTNFTTRIDDELNMQLN